MKFLEIFLWLLYACYGFLFLVFYVLLLVAGLVVGKRDAPSFVVDLLLVEASAMACIATFCSSLLWCADSGDARQRMRFLKITALLLPVSVFTAGSLHYRMVTMSADSFGVLSLFMIPLLLSMAACVVRSRKATAGPPDGGLTGAVTFRKLYCGSVFIVLLAVWNALLVLGDSSR